MVMGGHPDVNKFIMLQLVINTAIKGASIYLGIPLTVLNRLGRGAALSAVAGLSRMTREILRPFRCSRC